MTVNWNDSYSMWYFLKKRLINDLFSSILEKADIKKHNFFIFH